jgi:hypothetical protein
MPITTTKLSKNKTSRQCIKHRRLVTLSLQEQHPMKGTSLGNAMDRGSSRMTGAGLNPRHRSRPHQHDPLDIAVPWDRLALEGKLAEPAPNVKRLKKCWENRENLGRV